MARAVGYLRQSTDKQAASAERQRTAIAAWCQEHGHELVAVEHDDAVSGGTDPMERPGFVRALGHLRRGSLLVVDDRSRAGREKEWTDGVSYLARRAGARLVAVASPVLGDDIAQHCADFGTDLAAMVERRELKRKTREGLRLRREKWHAWNHAPFGWRIVVVDLLDAAGEPVLDAHGMPLIEKHLVTDDREQRILELVLRLREKGYTLRAIADALEEAGHRSRKDTAFSLQSVAHIIKRANVREHAAA